MVTQEHGAVRVAYDSSDFNSVGIDHETIANVGTRNKRIKPLSVERILAVIDSVELGLTRIFMIDHNITSPPLGDRVCPT